MRRFRCLGFGVMVGAFSLASMPAQAQYAKPCSDGQMTAEQAKKALAQEAFFKALALAADRMRFKGLDSTGEALAKRASFVNNADSLVITPVMTYLNNPTDEGLKAAYSSFFESVAKLSLEEAGKSVLQTTVFSNVGLVIEGGRLVIGSTQWAVEEMIDEGRRQEMEAAIFGRDDDIALGSINNLFAEEPFFTSGPVVNRRITRDNIGVTVTSEQQLRELWNYYGAYLKGGPMITAQSKADTDAMLREGWPHLLKFWAFKRLEGFLEAGHRTFSTEMLRVYDAAERGTLRAPCNEPKAVAAPTGAPISGTFGPPKVTYGQPPAPLDDSEKRFTGSVSEREVTLNVERKPVSEGRITITHTYKGNLPGNLRPGDTIELTCDSKAAPSGKSPPNIGGGCQWIVEGAAQVVNESKGSFVGIASDGKVYASSSSKTIFKVGSGPGTITITAARTGWAWVHSYETLDPVRYVYTFAK